MQPFPTTERLACLYRTQRSLERISGHRSDK